MLGGTAEARALSAVLIKAGFSVVTSLAGVTQQPLPVTGEVRSGGFGGEHGLIAYVRRERIAAIVDATHPFAAVMARHAALAAEQTRIVYLRLERPAWAAQSGDRWIDAGSAAAAAGLLPDGSRVFLTIGRKEIAPFMERPGLSGMVRMIEPPSQSVPAQWRLLLARPPFDLETEKQSLRECGITHVVSKNSGGESGKSKLVAARELNIPVVMIARPVKPAAFTAWPVDAAAATLARLLSP